MFIRPKSKQEIQNEISAGISSDDRDIVLGVAAGSSISTLLADLWAKYKSNEQFVGELRGLLARNASTPPEILEEIYTAAPESDKELRAACLVNPSLPASYVQEAAASQNPDLRKLAARNPALDELTLLHLSRDPDDAVAHTAFETMRRKCRT